MVTERLQTIKQEPSSEQEEAINNILKDLEDDDSD